MVNKTGYGNNCMQQISKLYNTNLYYLVLQSYSLMHTMGLEDTTAYKRSKVAPDNGSSHILLLKNIRFTSGIGLTVFVYDVARHVFFSSNTL